jgi:hypothetical protein
MTDFNASRRTIAVDNLIRRAFGFGLNESERKTAFELLAHGESIGRATADVINSILFNCMGGFNEPDWTQYTTLEIAPVMANADADGSTHCKSIPLYSDEPLDKADFWSVYARELGGCALAITDAPAERIAAVARKLRERSRLPLSIY